MTCQNQCLAAVFIPRTVMAIRVRKAAEFLTRVSGVIGTYLVDVSLEWTYRDRREGCSVSNFKLVCGMIENMDTNVIAWSILGSMVLVLIWAVLWFFATWREERNNPKRRRCPECGCLCCYAESPSGSLIVLFPEGGDMNHCREQAEYCGKSEGVQQPSQRLRPGSRRWGVRPIAKTTLRGSPKQGS